MQHPMAEVEQPPAYVRHDVCGEATSELRDAPAQAIFQLGHPPVASDDSHFPSSRRLPTAGRVATELTAPFAGRSAACYT